MIKNQSKKVSLTHLRLPLNQNWILSPRFHTALIKKSPSCKKCSYCVMRCKCVSGTTSAGGSDHSQPGSNFRVLEHLVVYI